MVLNKKRVAIIGSGFAGLSAASVLGKHHDVHLYEKNDTIGGRARQFSSAGFTFDMGPSWYWMPDVIERFFNNFGYQSSDFFQLKKLDPAFQMIFNEETLSVPSEWSDMEALFDTIEPGSAKQLNLFMKEAEFKYNVGVKDLVYQPGLSLSEIIRPDLIKSLFKLQVFSSFSSHVRKYFKNPKLIALMEFPILLLGAMPKQTPALYSLMNYSGLKVGTFYPMGGFSKVVDAMKHVAEENGVHIHTSSNVEEILLKDKKVSGLNIGGEIKSFDAVIGAADYHHVEQHLLPKEFRTYTENYWDKRVFAPSCLLFYMGVGKKLDKLRHHNLFFDENLDQHAKEIYESKVWPTKPLFYACCPSKTDPSVAPEGKENLFVLMPIAPGLTDTEELREEYYDKLLTRIEQYLGESVRDHVEYKKSYCVKDFESDYNAYKGNAYGLANTLMQTANLKPKIKSKKVKNLFYAGQLTTPGPGVPPSLISGQVVANQIIKELKSI